jgi:hypothetical protein
MGTERLNALRIFEIKFVREIYRRENRKYAGEYEVC